MSDDSEDSDDDDVCSECGEELDDFDLEARERFGNTICSNCTDLW